MGVPGFFAWLLKNSKKNGSKQMIKDNIGVKVKYLMLDTNCLLHPCAQNVLKKYQNNELDIDSTKELRPQLEKLIWDLVENYIDDMIEKVKPEIVYIAIDGVAPMGKVLQQRQRRYRYLFDKKIKLNEKYEETATTEKDLINEPNVPITSIELTPGTEWMERIHISMEKYMKKLDKKGIKYVYSSYHEEGEGEHKIIHYIKKNIERFEENTGGVVIYGLDADLLFLSLGIGLGYDLYIMREKQVFTNKEIDLDDFPEYNYVEIEELHKMIAKLDLSTEDFILLSYLIGNDFLPHMLTLDVNRGGLDKIISAFKTVINQLNMPIMDDQGIITNKLVINPTNPKEDYSINHDVLFEIFKELTWTEKHVWKNINRDPVLHQKDATINDHAAFKIKVQDEKKDKTLKFLLGLSDNTDCLSKIEFSSSKEYYSHYLGIECLDMDRTIIMKMVREYIVGLTWCLNYYLDDCRSWSWGYNFMVGPLIQDIINYYPENVNVKRVGRTLNPVEQLVLAIPCETYHYVIDSETIKKVRSNKKIGYMFPKSYSLDINKETKLWKCMVKIPVVEYDEYIKEIKSIGINGCKNTIYPSITNLI